MEARLGVYEKAPYESQELTEDMSTRLKVEGGHRQQERMIEAKRKSFDRALFNSYQAAEITAIYQSHKDNVDISLQEDSINIAGHVCNDIIVYVNPIDNVAYVAQAHPSHNVEGAKARALINPNVTKQDYDDKIISVGYEHNYRPGDIFYWANTNTYWLIYLQDLTELAYFKGDIRKCNYQVKWKNEQGKICETWFAVRGPVETKINYLQKNGVSLDTPNHTLNILMPKNLETLTYFKRYSKFYLSGVDEVTDTICWRVEATDSVSMPGVLEITAMEYYANESKDSDGIVNALVESPIKPDNEQSLIKGKNSIKPKISYLYEYVGNQEGQWHIESQSPVDAIIKDKTIEVSWPKSYSGEFTLAFGDSVKQIVVESLF